MKCILKVLLVFFIYSHLNGQTRNGMKMDSDTLVLEGLYSGKNILIKNAFGPGGIGFCVFEVLVNGLITTDEINANLFQIKLDYPKLALKNGDKVKVEIKYFKNCSPHSEPLVMNAGALLKPDAGKESTLVVDGKFMWANVFVTNPRIPGSNSFSIKEVLVNKKKLSVNFNSDVFEINLTALALQEKDKWNDGDHLKIEFKYQTGFEPVILNPEVIK